MGGLRVAATSFIVPTDGSKPTPCTAPPTTAPGRPGVLRASALVLDADVRVCIACADVIGLTKDIAGRIAGRIVETCAIPFENVLVTATHTHHAPWPMKVYGAGQNEAFCKTVEEAMAEAARQAATRLTDSSLTSNDLEAELGFCRASEATAGRNSRHLLKNGMIAWYPPEESEIVRPTGPFDPDLPVIAFARPGGALAATVFNHSTHNIGLCGQERPSPGLYGLVAQELERERGGVFLFLPGAFGSSHNFIVPDVEAKLRLATAVGESMRNLCWGLRGPLACIKREFSYRVRDFDDAAEDAAVTAYCRYRFKDAQVTSHIALFRRMRNELRPHVGETWKTWLQVIRLGEVLLVGIPGEMFARLGLAIKNRSPFRHTFVVGLANDEIGYIPDEAAYNLGGYQLWAGLHSPLAQGTGEAMVDAAVALLEEMARRDQPCEGSKPSQGSSCPAIRPIRPDEGPALQRFCNSLSANTRRLFRPLGWNASLSDCEAAVASAARGDRYDLVVEAEGRIVGWAFLGRMASDVCHLGIGLADEFQARGLGRSLMEALIAEARRRGKKGISLIVIQDNAKAVALYEKCGFRRTGDQTGRDGQGYFRMELGLTRNPDSCA